MGIALKIMLAVIVLLLAAIGVLSVMLRKTATELANTHRELAMLRAFSKPAPPSPVQPSHPPQPDNRDYEPPQDEQPPANVGDIPLVQRIEELDDDDDESDDGDDVDAGSEPGPVIAEEEVTEKEVAEEEEVIKALSGRARRHKRTRNQ